MNMRKQFTIYLYTHTYKGRYLQLHAIVGFATASLVCRGALLTLVVMIQPETLSPKP